MARGINEFLNLLILLVASECQTRTEGNNSNSINHRVNLIAVKAGYTKWMLIQPNLTCRIIFCKHKMTFREKKSQIAYYVLLD